MDSKGEGSYRKRERTNDMEKMRKTQRGHLETDRQTERDSEREKERERERERERDRQTDKGS